MRTEEQRAKSRASTRKWRGLDITDEEEQALYAIQGGRCYLTGVELDPRDAALDHDHDTGAPRGLVAGPVNRALGILGDTPEALRRIANALEHPPWERIDHDIEQEEEQWQ